MSSPTLKRKDIFIASVFPRNFFSLCDLHLAVIPAISFSSYARKPKEILASVTDFLAENDIDPSELNALTERFSLPKEATESKEADQERFVSSSDKEMWQALCTLLEIPLMVYSSSRGNPDEYVHTPLGVFVPSKVEE